MNLRTHPDYVSPAQTRILLEIIRQPRPTVRSVAHGGARSTRTIQQHLEHLRRRGLVTWQPRQRGTLRPAVKPVAFGPKASE